MVSVLIDYKLDRYTREIKYTFDYIFDTLGLGHRFIANPSHLRQNDILLLYGLIEPTLDELQTLAKHYITIFIQSDPRLFEINGFSPDQLRRTLRDVKLFSQTPIIAERKFDFPAENYTGMDIHACKVNFDLAGNVFYHLANREELSDNTRDSSGCFPEVDSAFYQWKDIPFVDNFLWLLDNLIKEQAKVKKQYIVQKHYWPRAQDLAIAITHSVDNLQKWDINSIFASVLDDLALLFTFRWQHLFRNVWSKLKYIFTNFEMYWNFKEYGWEKTQLTTYTRLKNMNQLLLVALCYLYSLKQFARKFLAAFTSIMKYSNKRWKQILQFVYYGLSELAAICLCSVTGIMSILIKDSVGIIIN